MQAQCPFEYLSFACKLADCARPIVETYFRANPETQQKANRTPVTIADRQVEACLRESIEAAYPAHGIIGEEFGASRSEARLVWVLDPIDGTHAFICGIPLFATLIALTDQGRPIMGLMDQAISGERWLGAHGYVATWNNQPAGVRACASLASATACISSPDYFKGANEAPFAALCAAVDYVRFGTSCYGYGLLASGYVDLVLDAEVKPHDYMAQVAIVESAGGIMTDWEGRPLDLALGASRVIAAGDRALHAEALALLARRG